MGRRSAEKKNSKVPPGVAATPGAVAVDGISSDSNIARVPEQQENTQHQVTAKEAKRSQQQVIEARRQARGERTGRRSPAENSNPTNSQEPEKSDDPQETGHPADEPAPAKSENKIAEDTQLIVAAEIAPDRDADLESQIVSRMNTVKQELKQELIRDAVQANVVVEDKEATPPESRRKTRMIAVGGILLVIVVGVVLGVVLSSDRDDSDSSAVIEDNNVPADMIVTSPTDAPSTPPTAPPSMPPIFGGCFLCPDESKVLKPDDLSLSINGLGDFNTCDVLESFVESALSESECSSQRDILDRNAVTCGCPGMESGNCPLCPDGSPPGNPDAFHSNGDQTCGELHELSLYMPADQCEENQVGFAAQGFLCGCPGVEPACTLCFGSTSVPDPSSPALGENGSCGETADEVLRLTPSECVSLKNALIANAIECGCEHDV